MKTTWGQIKQECIDLGFEKSTAYQKNQSIFINSINRAIRQISTTDKPNIERLTINHTPGTVHNMEELTKVDGKIVFHDFAESSPKNTSYQPINHIKDRSDLIIN